MGAALIPAGVGLVRRKLPKLFRGARATIGRFLGRRGRKVAKAVVRYGGEAGAYVGAQKLMERHQGGGSSGKPYRELAGQGGGRRYRRMNTGNIRALRRAIRRVAGFAKLARKIGFSRPPAKLKGVHLKGGRK